MSAFIGFAKATSTVEEVVRKFEPFGPVQVEEKVKFDARGRPFKIFFLHFTEQARPMLNTLPKRMFGWNVQLSNKEALPVTDDYWTQLASEFT